MQGRVVIERHRPLLSWWVAAEVAAALTQRVVLYLDQAWIQLNTTWIRWDLSGHLNQVKLALNALWIRWDSNGMI